ncbi:GDYXXLXY domain-containing protein [Leptospira perdikensis]|uniref:GDYXXLXY protein n=1 Tax=Leptospira perdikensis TaxID=2484948 RepID=A0A4R9JK87_9LEPT|nr:GDYXXLXY domain-containing protein [Leptospira perdikensis]TGL45890.1 GDYXXLXY protein [Leptospira perdikensis]
MKGKTILILTINLVLFMGTILYSVSKKETIRKEGRLIFLPLIPKDPRSLFQGDYMVLSYDWNRLKTEGYSEAPKRGCLVFQIENDQILPIRLQTSFTDIQPSEHCLQYYRNEFEIKVGAESYFFQEGDADIYVEAKFAGLRLIDGNTDGDKLLVGLYDKNKQRLGPKEQR